MPVESQIEQRIHQRITARSARRTEDDPPREEPPPVEPFHDAWVGQSGKTEMVRLAHAIVAQWLGSRLVIEPHERIAGRLALRSIVTWSFTKGISFDGGLWQREYADGGPERRAYLEELSDTWRHRATDALFGAVLTPVERALTSVQRPVGAGCHAAPLHVRLAEEGTEGLRRRVRASRAEHLGRPGTEPAEWYDALEVILDGLERLASAYARVAREMAAGEPDLFRREERDGIAERLGRIVRGPAGSFPDALQAYWLSMIVHGPIWADSPCRFDQDLWPFLERDLQRGTLTLEAAQEWVDAIWMEFVDHRCWSMTLSGQKPEGGDATNPLTWLLVSCLERFHTDAPNMALRVHSGTPPELLRKACTLLAGGRTMLSLVNDTPIVASMIERGIAPEHARDYSLVGCAQVISRGRSAGAFEDLICSAIKVLELALHDGHDPVSGRRMGPATGGPVAMDTYEKLEAAVFEQLEFMVRAATEVVNRQSAVVAQHYPDFLKSLLIEGCLERGRDYRRGGPLYTEGLADVLGVTNLADSLLVLRRMVYEQKHFSLPEFVEILDRNWEGHEAFRQECVRRIPKFGNEDDEADALTVRIVERINRAFKSQERVFGGRFGIDIVPWTGAVHWGRSTGATPDGRRSGEALADSVGATQGNDRSGVTAAIRSVAKLPHGSAHGTLVLNLRFASQTFDGHNGVDKMVSLVDTALGLGIQ